MRADRLVATLLLLQARGRLTAAELADELEVSVKTARRDLEALSVGGIPVYAQPGRGGGWTLLGGGRTDLSGLTEAEARALFLVAGPSSTVAPEAKAALRKLVRALPESFRAGAEAAAGAVVLDPASWGRRTVPRPPLLEVLQRAVVDGVQVRLGYTDRSRTETERIVHPLGLVEKGSTWYLVANTEAGLRTFRLSRVRSATPTGDAIVRPNGFDLTAAWEATVARVEERRIVIRARVLLPAEAVPWLRGQFPRAIDVVEQQADGRAVVEVGAANTEMLARHLAGWGSYLQVLGPDEVRAELARIGAELVAMHGSGAPGPVARRLVSG